MLTFGRTRTGALLSLGAGVAFAIQPVLGQLAFDRGATIAALLGWRYALAAVVLAVIARKSVGTMPRRVALSAFGLGLVLFAADSGLFYAAVERTSPPLATLLHYAHLVVVVGVAAVLGRERVDARRLAVVVGVLLGVLLVGGGGSPDALGVALALASAGAYAGYILVSDRLLRDVDPIAFAAVLLSGAATSFLVFGGATGHATTVGGAFGLVTVLVAALAGSVFAIGAFLAAIRLIGPGTASLLVTIEVPAGLALSAVVLGDRMSATQLLGAALVVASIVLLQPRLPRRSTNVLPLPTRSRDTQAAEAAAA